MERPRFDIVASGERMREIRRQRNISVKQVMEYMGFESTQACINGKPESAIHRPIT